MSISLVISNGNKLTLKDKSGGPPQHLFPPRDVGTEDVVQVPYKEAKREGPCTQQEDMADGFANLFREPGSKFLIAQ